MNEYAIDSGQKYHSSAGFLKAISGLYGISYLILAIVFSNYGSKVAFMLAQLKEDEGREQNREDSMLKLIYYRVSCFLHLQVILITTTLSLIFFGISIYNFIFTWGLIQSQTPGGMNPIVWEGVVQLFSEFFPSVIILAITYQNERKKD